MTSRFRIAQASVLLVCLFAFFYRLGGISLFDLDEALYVTAARQMVLTGDFVTPRLNTRRLSSPAEVTVPFFEKPILVYWLPAISMLVFGMHVAAARLPSALAALAVTWLVVAMGTHWFSRRAGLLAGLVYAIAPLTIANARQMTPDGLLVLWFGLSMIGAWNALAGAGAIWASVFWVACGLAVLTKGAAGMVLPGLVVVVYACVHRVVLRSRLPGDRRWLVRFAVRLRPDWRESLKMLRPRSGLAMFVAIVVPWHYLVWRAGGLDADGHTWFREYILIQHIGRFEGLDAVHNAPMLSYVAYYLVGFFPWACFTPWAFRRRWVEHVRARGWGGPEQVSPADRLLRSPVTAPDYHRFLLVWFWTVFVFFSLAAAKLPGYIAPAYPAAALLTGCWLEQVLEVGAGFVAVRSVRRGAAVAVAVAAALALVALMGPRLTPAVSPIPGPVAHVTLIVTSILLLCTAAAFAALAARAGSLAQRRSAFGALVGGVLVALGVTVTAGYTDAERNILGPYQRIAADARSDADTGIPIVYYRIIPRRPSMNYYARYSPIERKDAPLFPFLWPYLAGTPRQADVITTRDSLDGDLTIELRRAQGVSARIISERDGWVLVRLTQISKNAKTTSAARVGVGVG